jgi:spore maturation protein SpmB
MNGSILTTVIGALIAVLVAIQPLISTGQLDWKNIVLAALIALFGYIAKDKGVVVPPGYRDNGFMLVPKL